MFSIAGEDRVRYDCNNHPPEDVTLFVSEIMTKNPALFVVDGDDLHLQTIEVSSYTSELKVKAGDIGETYLDATGKHKDATVNVLATGETSEPAKRSGFLYDALYVFHKDNFLEDNFDFSSFVDDGFDDALIPEIRDLLLDETDGTMWCRKSYDYGQQEGNTNAPTSMPSAAPSDMPSEMPSSTPTSATAGGYTDVQAPLVGRSALGKTFPRMMSRQKTFKTNKELDELLDVIDAASIEDESSNESNNVSSNERSNERSNESNSEKAGKKHKGNRTKGGKKDKKKAKRNKRHKKHKGNSNGRHLEFDSEEEWTKLPIDSFTEGTLSPLPKHLQRIDMLSQKIDDDKKQAVLEALFGSGEGRPDAAELLSTFNEIDEIILDMYSLANKTEDGLISAYDLILEVEDVQEKLKKMVKLAKLIKTGLKFISMIQQIKPFIVPVRNAFEKLEDLLKKGKKKFDDIAEKTAERAKPKVQRGLNATESTKEMFAKTSFLNQKIFILPLHITRNCPLTDKATKKINPKVNVMKNHFQDMKDEVQEYSDQIKQMADELMEPISIIKHLLTEIRDIVGAVSFLNPLVNKFSVALHHKINLNVPGPFCTTRKNLDIPYPCGIKICSKKVLWSRIHYPCGVKFCHEHVSVTLPKWCTKHFQFTVGQIIDGIQGVMDFVMAPLNALMNEVIDGVLNAIGVDLNALPFPGLDIPFQKIHFGIDLPRLALPNLIDVSLFPDYDILDDIRLPSLPGVDLPSVHLGRIPGVSFPQLSNIHLPDFPNVDLQLPNVPMLLLPGLDLPELPDVDLPDFLDIDTNFVWFTAVIGHLLSEIDLDADPLAIMRELFGDMNLDVDIDTHICNFSPTSAPTFAPTEAPTFSPTSAPSEPPTNAPTDASSNAPTNAPTFSPTSAPTFAPTRAPTFAPTNAPTVSMYPSGSPSDKPSDAPTVSMYPSGSPSDQPTKNK